MKFISKYISIIKNNIPHPIKPLIRFIVDVLKKYNKDHSTLFAAAISFFGLLSFVPLLIFGVGIFGYVIGSHDQAFDSVIKFLNSFLPASSKSIETYLRNLSTQSTLLSGIGIIGLLWSGTQVFVILQQVINVAMEVKTPVSFIRGRSKAILVVPIVGFLFILSILLTSIIAIASHYRSSLIDAEKISVIWDSIGILVPVIISILAFTLIYKIMPARKMGFAAPLIGGITAGLLFEIAKNLYKLFVANFAKYDLAYGSLGTVVLFIFWTYYVSSITILGAEVASVYLSNMEKKKSKYNDSNIQLAKDENPV